MDSKKQNKNIVSLFSNSKDQIVLHDANQLPLIDNPQQLSSSDMSMNRMSTNRETKHKLANSNSKRSFASRASSSGVARNQMGGRSPFRRISLQQALKTYRRSVDMGRSGSGKNSPAASRANRVPSSIRGWDSKYNSVGNFSLIGADRFRQRA